METLPKWKVSCSEKQKRLNEIADQNDLKYGERQHKSLTAKLKVAGFFYQLKLVNSGDWLLAFSNLNSFDKPVLAASLYDADLA